MEYNTKILEITDIEKEVPKVKEAADILNSGGLVVFPTETVYGIGANALDSNAVANIFKVKGRPQDNPLIVHISDINQLDCLVSEVSVESLILADAFWPGPLTIVMPKSFLIPNIVSAGLETVAIRMPSHPIARAIIRMAGTPIAAPSANISGRPSPTNAKDCIADLNGKVPIIINGGNCDFGVESTVITLVGDTPKLLRPGAITIEQLRKVLGKVDIDDAVTGNLAENAIASSPGMKYKHYAPKANVTIVNGSASQLNEYIKTQAIPNIFALVFDEDLHLMEIPSLSLGPIANSKLQAHNLFTCLRELDEIGANQVYALCPSKIGIGLAVYNRLIRSAGFEQIHM